MKQRNQQSENQIGAAESERMFKYFQTVAGKGGKLEVSRKFKRSRSAVQRQAVKHNWKGRIEQIQVDIKKATDKALVKEEVTNLKLIVTVKKLICAKILSNKKYKATVNELTLLVRLEEELLQNLPTAGAGDNVVNIVNDNSELARILANAQIGLKAVTTTNRDRLSPL